MDQTRAFRIAFLGAGSMSEAMIKGILAARLLPAESITVCNRSKGERLSELVQRYGVGISQDKRTACAQADLVILAMKPFDLGLALQEVASVLSERQIIISVAAGVSTGSIEGLVGLSVPVIRAMPNTSSAVQASATAICAGRWATAEHMDLAQRLFSASGLSVVVEERHMDAVTGLSGTGPAYFYYVVEALLNAGQSCGLPADTCRTLLVQTLYGAARMLQETNKDPAELRRQVTSPNGTTMAAIAVLDLGAGQQLFLRAVQAATQRAVELGALFGPVPDVSTAQTSGSNVGTK
jgi:pyrroline-5-carboxylate reductase